jgi:ribose/xylose/arabinose/galactoside ABC-type transport system permease subunit
VIALWSRLRRRSDTRVIIIFLLVLVGLIIISPQAALSPIQVLGSLSISGLIALGLTVVIVQGAFDLSVGATATLAGILAVKLSDHSFALGLAGALVCGLVIGVVNGCLVVNFGINSFIATIASMTAIQGVAYVLTNSQPVTGKDVSASITFISSVVWFLTPEMLIFLGMLLVIHLLLSRTQVGRDFYAVGGDREAARAAGIPIGLRTFQGFVICGMLAALAGWVTAIQSASASPEEVPGVALVGITAVVVGGASLKGGTGTALGSAIGAAMLAWVATTFNGAGISTTLQDLTDGGILLIVVLASRSGAKAPIALRLRAWLAARKGVMRWQ